MSSLSNSLGVSCMLPSRDLLTGSSGSARRLLPAVGPRRDVVASRLFLSQRFHYAREPRGGNRVFPSNPFGKNPNGAAAAPAYLRWSAPKPGSDADDARGTPMISGPSPSDILAGL